MTFRVRLFLSFLAILIATVESGCSHYICDVTFGASSCPSSGSSGSGGTSGGGSGGGSSSAQAYAYAVDENGTVDGYALNATAGTFASISGFVAPAIPTSDVGIGMVVAQEQFVYAYFESNGELYGWSITSTSGALTPLTGFPIALSLNAPLVAYNEYNVAINPAGTLLFIADTANDQIYAYQISTAGALTAATGSPFSTGATEPGNVATDGLGKYLYVTQSLSGHTGGEVLAYTIGSDGALTAVTGSPFTFAEGLWQVAGDPSGGYLIGTTGGSVYFGGTDDKNLYVFNIATGTNAGAISEVSGSPFITTYSPFNIAVAPASGEELVYSFGINDAGDGYNPIEGLSLDTTTGALTWVADSPFSNFALGHWGQFDQSGSYLAVYSSATNGTSTTTQLSVLDVDSTTGALTQPISPATLATPGYWVITDPE